MLPIYGRFIDNFGQSGIAGDAALPYQPGTRCLIISHARYKGPALSKLADWINSRGYETRVIYVNAAAQQSDSAIRDSILKRVHARCVVQATRFFVGCCS